MAVKSKAEILDAIRGVVSDSDSDDALELMGDVSDTIDSFDSYASEIEKLKKEKEDLDKSWRERYRNRFYGKVDEEQDFTEVERDKPKKFEDLFKED